MNVNYLIEFVYLAETLSFRKTADYFYVSRSVISRHLAAIEDTLGTKLFERGSRSVQLTEAGKVFYREAQTVLRAYADAVDRTREAGSVLGRKVRLGYLKNAARPVIVRFVRYLRHERPEIQLELTCMEFSDLRRAFEEETVDIALAVNVHPRMSSNYRSTLIYTDRFYVMVGKDHPLAGRVEGVSFDELPREKLLLPDTFIYAGVGQLVGGLEEGHRVSASDYYNDVDLLYLKVQAEGYIAFTSGLNSAMFGDRLAIVPIAGVDTTFSVSAFYGNHFIGDVFIACRKGFESCRAALNEQEAGRGGDIVGFTMADLG